MKHHQVRDVTQQEVCLLQEVAAQQGVEHFLFPAGVLIGGNTPFSSPPSVFHPAVRRCHVAAIMSPPSHSAFRRLSISPLRLKLRQEVSLQTPLSHPATCDPRRHTGEQLLLAARRETNQVEPDSPEQEGRGRRRKLMGTDGTIGRAADIITVS